MPSHRSAPTDTQPDAPGPIPPRPVDEPRLGISTAQVAGSALAAVSAAFFASWLGVAGTLIGAALGSVVGTVGSASYTYSLQRSHALVRGCPAHRAPQRSGPPAPGGQWPWRRIAAGGAAVLALTLGTLTVVEGIVGKPVSSMTSGGDGGGTTIGRVVRDEGPRGDSPTPSEPTAPTSPTPSPSTDPTSQPTDQPSGTPSPSVQPTGSPSPTPSDETSPTGSPGTSTTP